MLNILLPTLLFLTSVFLILLVLIQRGRGGGLAGAFGGLGGQSAFGTKAGDLFTRITIGVATFWIILSAASIKLLNEGSESVLNSDFDPKTTATAPPATGSTGPGAAGGAAKDAKPGAAGANTAPKGDDAKGAEKTAPAADSEK